MPPNVAEMRSHHICIFEVNLDTKLSYCRNLFNLLYNFVGIYAKDLLRVVELSKLNIFKDPVAPQLKCECLKAKAYFA